MVLLCADEDTGSGQLHGSAGRGAPTNRTAKAISSDLYIAMSTSTAATFQGKFSNNPSPSGTTTVWHVTGITGIHNQLYSNQHHVAAEHSSRQPRKASKGNKRRERAVPETYSPLEGETTSTEELHSHSDLPKAPDDDDVGAVLANLNKEYQILLATGAKNDAADAECVDDGSQLAGTKYYSYLSGRRRPKGGVDSDSDEEEEARCVIGMKDIKKLYVHTHYPDPKPSSTVKPKTDAVEGGGEPCCVSLFLSRRHQVASHKPPAPLPVVVYTPDPVLDLDPISPPPETVVTDESDSVTIMPSIIEERAPVIHTNADVDVVLFVGTVDGLILRVAL